MIFNICIHPGKSMPKVKILHKTPLRPFPVHKHFTYCSILYYCCLLSYLYFVHMYSHLVKDIFIRTSLHLFTTIEGEVDSVLLYIILTNYIAISVMAVYDIPSCLNITFPREEQQIKIISLPSTNSTYNVPGS